MPLDLPHEDVQRLEARIFHLEEEVRKGKAARNAMSQSVTLLQVDGIEIGDDFLRGEKGALQLKSTSSLFPAIAFVNDFHDPTANPAELGIAGTKANGGVFGFVTTAGRVQLAFGASTDANNKAYILTESQSGSGFMTFNVESGGNSAGPQLSAANLGNSWTAQLDFGDTTLVQLGRRTADPTTVQDFDVWGRSDLDKARIRLNGTTENLATETYADAAGGGGMELLVQEADQNFSSTTPANTELLFAVAADEVFQFEGVLVGNFPGAADLKVTATGPTGAVGTIGTIYTDVTGAQDAGNAQLGTDIPMQLSNGGLCRFWGGIHNGGNAGNLTIQIAQVTASGTSTLWAGSYIKWQAES